MVIIDQAMGKQMIEAEVAIGWPTQLEFTDIVFFGPHHMMGHQTMDVHGHCRTLRGLPSGQGGTLNDATAHYDASGDPRHGLQVREGHLRCHL